MIRSHFKGHAAVPGAGTLDLPIGVEETAAQEADGEPEVFYIFYENAEAEQQQEQQQQQQQQQQQGDYYQAAAQVTFMKKKKPGFFFRTYIKTYFI